jgi:hypothetical protein
MVIGNQRQYKDKTIQYLRHQHQQLRNKDNEIIWPLHFDLPDWAYSRRYLLHFYPLQGGGRFEKEELMEEIGVELNLVLSNLIMVHPGIRWYVCPNAWGINEDPHIDHIPSVVPVVRWGEAEWHLEPTRTGRGDSRYTSRNLARSVIAAGLFASTEVNHT